MVCYDADDAAPLVVSVALSAFNRSSQQRGPVGFPQCSSRSQIPELEYGYLDGHRHYLQRALAMKKGILSVNSRRSGTATVILQG